MGGIYGFVSTQDIDCRNFEEKKRHFKPVVERRTTSVDFKFEDGYFCFANFPVRNSFDRKYIVQEGETYNCPAGITEHSFIRNSNNEGGIGAFTFFFRYISNNIINQTPLKY